jgi:hypothetical protein
MTTALTTATRLRAARIRGLVMSNDAPERRSGKLGWLLLWLLGVPIPVLLILFVLRGCT